MHTHEARALVLRLAGAAQALGLVVTVRRGSPAGQAALRRDDEGAPFGDWLRFEQANDREGSLELTAQLPAEALAALLPPAEEAEEEETEGGTPPGGEESAGPPLVGLLPTPRSTGSRGGSARARRASGVAGAPEAPAGGGSAAVAEAPPSGGEDGGALFCTVHPGVPWPHKVRGPEGETEEECAGPGSDLPF